jgi:hypothetical protein
MSRQSIPLDVIDVKTPCPASWETMRGDERTRYCVGCGRNVHNLSAMTRREAETFLADCAGAGRLCVRFERSGDGTVQTLDYRTSARTGRGRGWRFWTGLSACLAAGVALANAWFFRNRLPPPIGRPPVRTMVMGDVAFTPPPQTQPTVMLGMIARRPPTANPPVVAPPVTGAPQE